MQDGIVVQGEIQAAGMRQPLGQREGLAAPGQRLVWIPKPPQPPARTGEAYDSRVSPTTERQRMAVLGVIERHPLSKARLRRDDIANDKKAPPYMGVCSGERRGRAKRGGEAQAFFRQLGGGGNPRRRKKKPPQAYEHGESL